MLHLGRSGHSYCKGLDRFIKPSLVTQSANLTAPITEPLLFDERDPEAREKKRAAMDFGN